MSEAKPPPGKGKSRRPKTKVVSFRYDDDGGFLVGQLDKIARGAGCSRDIIAQRLHRVAVMERHSDVVHLLERLGLGQAIHDTIRWFETGAFTDGIDHALEVIGMTWEEFEEARQQWRAGRS